MRGEPDQSADESQRHLQEIEERVRKVRHLEAFDFSEREDGRFSFRLKRPPSEISSGERETIARLLTSLAEDLRSR